MKERVQKLYLILRTSLICSVLACLAMLPFAQTAMALDVKYNTYSLPNGLQLVVIPDHRAPVVTHSIWYRVGSADEISGKSGLAHFLEHLLFKGTKKFPVGEFDHLLRTNGGEGNAFTTRDYTAYYQRAASDRLPMLMELESDRMQNLVLTEDIVKPELLVVREERRQRTENSPSSLLSEQADAALYTAHPYGRPVVGWMSEVADLTKDDALDFYRKHYEPANAMVIVAGDVDPDAVMKLATRYYGPLQNTAHTPERKRTPEPQPIAARRVSMIDERTETPYFYRTYLAPSYKSAPEETAALEFYASALGSGSRSRLYKSLVIEQKLASEAGAYMNGDQLDSGTFSVYAVPNPGVTLAKIEMAIDTELAKALAQGATQAELDRDRNRALIEMTYSLDDQMNLMRMAGTAAMTGSEPDKLFSTEHWQQVTVDAMNTAARKYLRAENSVTATLARSKED
jgi:zinc protease